jgi:type III secretion protein U
MTRSLWLSQAPLLFGSFIEQLGQASTSTRLDLKDLLMPLGGLGLVAAMAALMVASLLGLIGNIVQTGFTVAPDSIARLDRLDPIAHAKKFFSSEQLMTLGMNTVKLVAIASCTAAGVLLSLDSVLRMGNGTLLQAAELVVEVLVKCERLALVVLILCVALDWVIRKREHIKSLRMSQEEVEREQKDQYGDKHVRSQRNEMRRDMLVGELTEGTRKANAVVTNPTHFAVALLYDPARFPLPVVVARGADAKAARMREIAREEGIPIIRSVQLARSLYSVGREWQPVPRVALKAVAAVYRVVAEIRTGERRIDDFIELDDEVPQGGGLRAPR